MKERGKGGRGVLINEEAKKRVVGEEKGSEEGKGRNK